MVKISKKIVLIVLLLQMLNVVAQEAFISDNSVTIDWKTVNKDLVFSKAIYPKEFSGLPVYHFSTSTFKNNSVEFAIQNPVFKPLQDVNLSADQVKLISNQLVVSNAAGFELPVNGDYL